MVNSKRKGDRREREAKELLEEQGYRVSKSVHSRFGETDFLGLFDLIAAKISELKFIQVKCNKAQGKKELENEIRDSLPAPKTDWIHYELWIRYDYSGWRKLRYSPFKEKFVEVYDGREK